MSNGKPDAGSQNKKRDVQLMRFYNCCLEALDILYELAESGSAAARELLHHEADRLNEKAGNLHRFQR